MDLVTAAVPSIQTLLKTLEQEIKTTRGKIRRCIDDDPTLKNRRDLLDSIPGLGETGIAHLLG